MSRDTIEQYETVRQAVNMNVAAIRALLEQADDLNEVVDEVADPEAKAKLRKSLDALYARIEELIADANYLIKHLIRFSESITATAA